MSVRTEFVQDDLRFAVTVTCDNLGSETAIARTFDELEEARNLIAQAIRDNERYYYYNIVIDCPNAPAELQPDLSRGFDPWETFGKAFWPVVVRDSRFRDRVSAALSGLSNLLPSDGGGMHEYDETAFGEPVVTALALADVYFVRFYTRFLRDWDMETEVFQYEAIDKIVRRHGLCPETESLLLARFGEAAGQMGIDQFETLLPFLEEATGGFAGAPLFRQMVAGLVTNPVKSGPDDSVRHWFDGDLMTAARQLIADQCLEAAERWRPSSD